MAYYQKRDDGAVELVPVEDEERARDYEGRRFGGKRYLQRLDVWEKGIVADLLEKCGRDAHVLDAPCGTGRFFDILKDAGELTMVDVSEHMLNVARERSEGHANVHAILGDVTKLPLADGSVDLAICMRLFHHIPTEELRSAAIRELARVSRRYVALSFYNKSSWKYWRRALRFGAFDLNYNSVSHMTGIAKRYGLSLIERHPAVNLVQPQCILVFNKS